eukprot:364332-Chlamydomonas_euryale.AAC.2
MTDCAAAAPLAAATSQSCGSGRTMLPGTGIRQCMAGGCMATAPDAPAATTAARAAADSVASPFKLDLPASLWQARLGAGNVSVHVPLDLLLVPVRQVALVRIGRVPVPPARLLAGRRAHRARVLRLHDGHLARRAVRVLERAVPHVPPKAMQGRVREVDNAGRLKHVAHLAAVQHLNRVWCAYGVKRVGKWVACGMAEVRGGGSWATRQSGQTLVLRVWRV